MEALQQRLAKYKEAEDQAKQEGASSKMKRMGRIVKVQPFCCFCKVLHVFGRRLVLNKNLVTSCL